MIFKKFKKKTVKRKISALSGRLCLLKRYYNKGVPAWLRQWQYLPNYVVFASWLNIAAFMRLPDSGNDESVESDPEKADRYEDGGQKAASGRPSVIIGRLFANTWHVHLNKFFLLLCARKLFLRRCQMNVLLCFERCNNTYFQFCSKPYWMYSKYILIFRHFRNAECSGTDVLQHNARATWFGCLAI